MLLALGRGLDSSERNGACFFSESGVTPGTVTGIAHGPRPYHNDGRSSSSGGTARNFSSPRRSTHGSRKPLVSVRAVTAVTVPGVPGYPSTGHRQPVNTVNRSTRAAAVTVLLCWVFAWLCQPVTVTVQSSASAAALAHGGTTADGDWDPAGAHSVTGTGSHESESEFVPGPGSAVGTHCPAGPLRVSLAGSSSSPLRVRVTVRGNFKLNAGQRLPLDQIRMSCSARNVLIQVLPQTTTYGTAT
eukprot:1378410-Rhodomonas_salina.2